MIKLYLSKFLLSQNEHTEELEALKQHYEQVKLEVIGAVNTDVEEEIEKMKEQLTSAHQLVMFSLDTFF